MNFKFLLIMVFFSVLHASFLDIGLQTKNLSLARSGSAGLHENACIFMNPAGLGYINKKYIFINYGGMFAGQRPDYDVTGYVSPTIINGILGLAYPMDYLNFGFSLAVLNSKIYSESILSVSIGKKIGGIILEEDEVLLLGSNLKLMTINYAFDHVVFKTHSNVISQPEIDFGVVYSLKKIADFSIVLKNLLRADFGVLAENVVPLEAIVGVSKKLNSSAIHCDLKYRTSLNFSIGFEIYMLKDFFVLIGINRSEISAGVLTKLFNLEVSYGFVYQHLSLFSKHFIGLVFYL